MAQNGSSQSMQAEMQAEQSLPSTASRAAGLLDRPISSYIRFDWETGAWLLLFIVAIITRFYDLGVRAMSHDESLHTLYSYYLYDAGNYEHNPMMHGPLLFHLNALMYGLFGATDASARIAPVLSGLGVIWMARLFRRYIGRTGALLAGLFLVASPSILFHSRYIRNDIYIAFFLLIWVYGAFRYLETRRPRWMAVMMLGMALGFIAKENHFMNGGVMGVFFVGLALWQVIGRKLAPIAGVFVAAAGLWYFFHIRDRDDIGLVVLGIAVLAILVMLGAFIRQTEWKALRVNPSADLAILMLTLVLPFTAPFLHLALGWDAMAYATNTDLLRSVALVGIMTLLSLAIAYFWFGMRSSLVEAETDNAPAGEDAAVTRLPDFVTWGQLMAGFWGIQILFFTTFFTNTRNGLATGIVGSLGYWLAQQEVARGGQPWYYYFMLGGLYEFLPWLLSGVGMVVTGYWLLRQPDWDPVDARDLPPEVAAGEPAEQARAHRVYMAVFGIWWILATWASYTVAGEKMPWLMTHMALPMCLYGGWYLGRLLHRIDWPVARRTNAILLIGLAPALGFLLVRLVTNLPGLGREVAQLAGSMQWLVTALVTGLVGYGIWHWGRGVGWAAALRLLSLGLVALLFLLTIRFSFMLTYINYDMATEYLVYAHASPDVKRALNEIDRISERTVGERNIVVAYDDQSSWPLSWYMRLYPNSRFYGSQPNSDVMSAPVIIVGRDNFDKVHPYVVRDYVKRTYRLVWWPDQGYFNLTWQRFWETIRDPEKLSDIAQIVFYRRYRDDAGAEWRDLTQWPNRHEFEMWVHRDIAEQVWDLSAVPLVANPDSATAIFQENEIDLAAQQIFTGPFGDVALAGPRDVAVGSDGRQLVADTNNHRIVALDQAGGLLWTVGSYCNMAEGEASGCVDPDGSGPLALGDGQFYEPWGVAVDDAGNVYVADTWNGRIQAFDAAGNFLRKWGIFASTGGELGDGYALYGPRSLAVDRSGNLLVSDTGNKRILRFSPAGEFLEQIGGGGVVPGRFEEPVGLAVDPNDGSIYVADTWNQRIQKFGPDLTFVAEWPVGTWESQDREHKPYLAVAPSGAVYASDPAMYRILVFEPTGDLAAVFGNYGAELNRFGLPNGLAVDPVSGSLLVADAGNNRLMQFPIVR